MTRTLRRPTLPVGAPGWKNGLPCCTLTGTLLTPDSIVIVTRRETAAGQRPMSVPDVRRGAGYGERLSAPVVLHRSRQEGAVGLEYAADFAHYLAGALHELRLDQDYLASAWWLTPYGIGRVRQGLRARFALRIHDGADEQPKSLTRAQAVLTAVLDLHRSHDSLGAATRASMPADQLWRYARLCLYLAHRSKAHAVLVANTA